MINKIKTLWKWLNGKKTVIGGFIVWISALPHLSEIIPQQFVDVVYYVGTGLLLGGGVHKVAKRVIK